MNWQTHIHAAMVDLTAALTCNDDSTIDHITDAEINLEKAKSAWEEDAEATSQ